MMSHHPHSPPSKKRKASTTPTPLKSSSASLPLEIWGRCILPFCDDPELLAMRATNSTFHGLVHPLLLAKTAEPIKHSYDLTVLPKSKFQYCRLTCQVIARPPPPENRNNDDLPRSTTDQRIPQRTEQHNAPTFLSFQHVKNHLERRTDFRLEPERDDELGEDQLGEREWGIGLYGDKFENPPGWKGFIRKMDYKMEEFLGTMKFNRKIGLDKEEVDKLLTKWRQLTCCTRYRLLRRNIREGENPTPILRDRYTHADFSYEEETDEESDMYTETYSFFLEVELFNGEQVELMLTREAKMHKHVRTGYKPYRPSASRKAWANTKPS